MRRTLPRAALAIGATVAYGRQTAPDGQLSPAYGLASPAHITPSSPPTCWPGRHARTGRP